MSGIEGYTSVYHATVSEGLTEISNLPMVQNQWHHLASVVDKDAGTLRHYLNGALVAESFFSSGESGEVTLGDWFLGGMPALDRFQGLLDDARLFGRLDRCRNRQDLQWRKEIWAWSGYLQPPPSVI